MPTYQYACTACSEGLEIQQSFSDDALTVCPQCKGRLRKVFGAVGVVFKGSGFYRTDSRAAAAAAKAGSDGDSKSDGKSDGKSDSGAAESKPAAKESTGSGRVAKDGPAAKPPAKTGSDKSSAA